MDDLFYFSKARVGMADLSALAAELGYEARLIQGSGGDELNVTYQDNEFWQWIPISASSGDFDSFDGLSRARVEEFGPESAYIIAHRPLSWPLLRTFLRRLLDRFGGWVGSDTDGWEPTFTRENIDSRPYEPYLEALDWQTKSDSLGGT